MAWWIDIVSVPINSRVLWPFETSELCQHFKKLHYSLHKHMKVLGQSYISELHKLWNFWVNQKWVKNSPLVWRPFGFEKWWTRPKYVKSVLESKLHDTKNTNCILSTFRVKKSSRRMKAMLSILKIWLIEWNNFISRAIFWSCSLFFGSNYRKLN